MESNKKQKVELSHPLITDGWFREISEQWPGQAMTLRVKKILHVEQSQYQDVLVFESTDHGNVLVLDGAIQCVERDEFSYQEMITQLPLNSHPNPVDVLVIGGGDGGVLREVLKHPKVKNATLCDIDEAVPRVSKDFLPHMAAGFDDPRVTVHIGDGFKFLEDKKASFDVIITDSSDPVGPANSLFQKPYFQLLKEALKEGGSISTQAECMWLHLPLIKDLLTMSRTLFPVAEYAFTSIPTYPSGCIGFVVCSLDPTRNVRRGLLSIPNTRYYTKRIHEASFVLPKFVQDVVDEATGKAAAPVAGGTPKKVLLLGSGFVAQPAADFVLRRAENTLTVGCRTLANAQAFVDTLADPARATALAIDVTSTAELEAAVAAHDLVVSLIPYTFHEMVIRAAIKHKKHVVTTSYVSDALAALHDEAAAAGITVMNEIGLDPGLDHLYAVKTIDDVHRAGGKIKEFISFCGGLPAPEDADNPFGYKFSWSPRGVLLAARNSAQYYADNKVVEIDGPNLMAQAKPYFIQPGYNFVGYPNRDSTVFREKYNIPEAETVLRGTLRYDGMPAFIGFLVKLGFFSDEPQAYLAGSEPVAWRTITAQAIGAADSTDAALIAKIEEICAFPTPAERNRIIAGLRWIGLTTDETIVPQGNLLDTFCAVLQRKMEYAPGERDLVMLQHKFVVENKDGSIETRTTTLLDYGAPYGSGQGPSSMARTVGIPCGIAIQLVLDGVISKRGVLAPYTRDLVDPLLAAVEAEGIHVVERVL